MDYDNNMYDTNDLEIPKLGTTPSAVSATAKGSFSEIEINGKKIEVVSPAYVKELERVIASFNDKFKVMDSIIRSMDFASKQQSRLIADLRRQMDGKIDRN